VSRSESAKNHAGGAGSEIITVSPERKPTTYRLDPLISRAFVEACKKAGHSSCSVLEAFEYGFTRAVSAGDYHEPRPMTLNLTLVHQVERPRRGRPGAPLDDRPGVLGDPSTCFMCGQESVYLGILSRTSPQVQAYACGSCRFVLGDLKGYRVEKIKNVRRTWVSPGDPSL